MSTRTWSAARRALPVVAALAVVAASCGGDDSGSSSDTTAAAATTAAATTAAATTAAATSAAPTTAGATTTAKPAETDFTTAFPDLEAPTGEPITIGLVNTEGVPGLDFPDFRIDIQASVDYLNEHGGFGGRPITLETCTTQASPETSQACAQELVGKDVEMVLIGLDLFPDYATYDAAGVPVFGALPLLPPDFTSSGLFFTGGNNTAMAAIAAAAKEHYNASTVGIVSTDNPAGNAALGVLTAALDKAGITSTVVKGGDNETDAGYQGLLREATKDNPDLLVSLYSDAGCIGTMRGRAALGIDIPAITTNICASGEVLDQVGGDAEGWSFVGVTAENQTPQWDILREIMAPVLKVDAADVDVTSLGLGGIGIYQTMSAAMYANMLQAEGTDPTAKAVYDLMKSSKDLTLWPGGLPVECGKSTTYPTICTFILPYGEIKDGKLVAVEGLKEIDTTSFLP
jgi:branched-chain amino acid transport system substrate-binding protein